MTWDDYWLLLFSWVCGLGRPNLAVVAYNTFEWADVWSSFNNYSKAWEITGFIEVNDRDVSSVTYLRFTRFGSSRCVSLNHVSTIIFSKVGNFSSSWSTASRWCVMCPLSLRSLFLMKDIKHWQSISGRSSCSSLMLLIFEEMGPCRLEAIMHMDCLPNRLDRSGGFNYRDDRAENCDLSKD